MPSNKRTVSARLDPAAAHRLELAARLMKQSRSAFLASAADEMARRVLLDWAVARHQQGERTFSELADETGLAVEELMQATGATDRDAAREMFLASCQTIAEIEGKPDFLRVAQEAAQVVWGNR